MQSSGSVHKIEVVVKGSVDAVDKVGELLGRGCVGAVDKGEFVIVWVRVDVSDVVVSKVVVANGTQLIGSFRFKSRT